MLTSPFTTLKPYAIALVATAARRTAWVAIGSAVITAAVLGGWSAAPSESIPEVAAGESVDLGQLRVEVIGWEVRGVAQEALEDYPGADAWLFLELVMSTATDRTERARPEVLELPDEVLLDPDNPEPHRLMLLRDATRDPSLQPGIPERVVMVWPVAADSVGDAASLPLRLIQYEQFSAFSTGELIWTTAGVAATVDAPRDDRVGSEFVAPPASEPDADQAGDGDS